MPVYDRTTVPERVGRGTLDPELAAWLPRAPVLGADERIADARRSHRALGHGPHPPIGQVRTLVLDGPHGSLPVRAHDPRQATGAPRGALVYLHGGGWTVGTPDEFETPMRLLAEHAGITTYAVDYRLAPEAKYPVQLEECAFVVRWLVEHAAEENVDPARIALGGDSAGGNMTCALTLRFRDEGGPRLAAQAPLYPETALPFDTPAGSENRCGHYLETAGILLFAWNYLPHDVDLRDPSVSPLHADSHADLPPALLVTTGFDPLRDVGHAYAWALAEAGNDLTYVHHPNLTHGFLQFTRHSAVCARATEQVAEHLRLVIGRGATGRGATGR
ncbi:Acetyl esterase/lipase [Streptoalloteichus tenebrarius]|uniref:Acetyl esterase/lipase n=1 Tax=Streptoalloteichus tenebrarius (strain ATCC 17920 / DSM 40477 / JCM 4838 / CBS 697.72 / NBRC 16177 / NCIMB 11028 / NRRL B-12390 / A12253. 1 / ISP 5477) TaxID=1933 RepID=A0ABT1I475_STRSD|nr:alpha/beta hydrolase [Streptoalloteichus tenebrarius]MCP2262549.1 Acetyl esterase/lipase [Streptoalloteichus tenebrarius]BFE98653.1 alpha/beta hydrolase [Streptoalloteichus tenebrarius]